MIVRVTGELRVLFGRVDADGDVVNETPFTFPMGKFCDEEWARVFAEIRAKHQELTAGYERYTTPPAETDEPADEPVDETIEPAAACETCGQYEVCGTGAQREACETGEEVTDAGE